MHVEYAIQTKSDVPDFSYEIKVLLVKRRTSVKNLTDPNPDHFKCLLSLQKTSEQLFYGREQLMTVQVLCQALRYLQSNRTSSTFSDRFTNMPLVR